MNKETMKQGMIKVLNMYDIPWGNSAIDKIIPEARREVPIGKSTSIY